MVGAHLIPFILKFRERNCLRQNLSSIRGLFCHNPPQSQAGMGKHPSTCNSPAYPNTWQTSGELLRHAERWQDVVREKFFTALLGRWAEGSKKPSVSFPRPFFLGRDDKYPSHLMTVAHILCDKMLLSKGEERLREVSHILSLS